MNVMRSQAQPELIYVLLTEQDAESMITALKRPKNETARQLRRALKDVRHV